MPDILTRAKQFLRAHPDNQLIADLVRELEHLHQLTSSLVTVGGGMQVYGTIAAVERVQAFIIASHPMEVEKEQNARYFAGELAHAEARLAFATALINELNAHEGAEGWSVDLNERLDQFFAGT